MNNKSHEFTAEKILRIVLDSIPIRVFWKDKDSRFLGGNKMFLDDLGLKHIDELVGKKDSDFFKEPTVVANFREDDLDVLNSAKPKIAIEEVLPFDGQSDKWLRTNKTPMFDDEEQVIGILGTYEEITEEVQYRQKIEQQAMVDPLTGIANRRKLQNTIEAYKDKQAGLLFIDLDYFKAVNDSLGHSVGDVLLQTVAKRLSALCNTQNVLLARLGGDEFSIFVPFKGEGDIRYSLEKLAQSIIDLLTESFAIDHHILSIGASIGITVIDRTIGIDASGFREADMAMYSAKENGRNNYQFYDMSMRADTERKHKMIFSLQSAIERNELSLVYQPQFDKHENLLGAEALLRWHNQDLGYVLPDEFIPLAEETGLIHDIGEWVLFTALDALCEWRNLLALNPSFKLAVNVSSKQFKNKKLANIVEGALRSRDLKPYNLQLEITESVLMEHADIAVKSMLKMQQLGISFAIDDFGTGYSSLSYLAILPIDKLKIDRSFVTDLQDKSTNRKLVETLVNMSKNLQMEVIAEGVETLDEKEALVDLDCNQFQGYFFAKPMSKEQFNLRYAFTQV